MSLGIILQNVDLDYLVSDLSQDIFESSDPLARAEALVTITDHDKSYDKKKLSASLESDINNFIERGLGVLFTKEHQKALVLLASKIPLCFDTVKNALHKLISGCSDILEDEFVDYKQLCKNDTTMETLPNDIATILSILHSAVVAGGSAGSVRFENDLCLLQGLKDHRSSQLANSILVSLEDFKDFSLIWKSICYLLSASDQHYVTIGYRLWVKFVQSDCFSASMNRVLNSELYWQGLRNGIRMKSYDCKKYSLYILAESIELASTDISLPSMNLRVKEKQSYILAWKRFSTLVEIISIDSSIHQTEASVLDIRELLGEKSPIPMKWVITLLSAGLTCTMESVRNVIGEIILSLGSPELTRLETEAEFVACEFLKFAMLAKHFVASKDQNGRIICPFGDKMRFFIFNLLKSFHHGSSRTRMTSLIIKHLHDTRMGFDPARIYVLLGLYDASDLISIDNGNDLFLLLELCRNPTTETELRHKLLCWLCVELSFSTDLNSVSLESWLKHWSQLVKIIGERIVKEHFNRLKFKLHNSTLQDYSHVLDPISYVALYGDSADISRFKINELLSIASSSLPACQKVSHRSDFIGKLELDVSHLVENDLLDYKVLQKLIELRLDALLKTVKRDSLLFGLSLAEYYCEPVSASSIIEDIKQVYLKPSSKSDREYKEMVLFEYVSKFQRAGLSGELSLVDALDVINVIFSPATAVCRGILCDTLKIVLRKSALDASTEGLLCEVLKGIWDCIGEDRLISTQRSLHLKYIDLLYVEQCTHYKLWSQLCEEIGHDIISLSFARRSLLPRLASNLFELQEATWVCLLFLHIFTFEHISNNLFNLEHTMADVLDELTGLHDSYVSINGPPEIRSRILAAAYIANLNSPEVIKNVVDHIISPTSSYHIFKTNRRNDGEEERRRVWGLQVLTMIFHRLEQSTKNYLAEQLLIPALSEDASPLARAHIEWIIAYWVGSRYLKNTESTSCNVILDMLSDAEQEPRLLATFMRTGLLLARYLKRSLWSQSSEIVINYYSSYLNLVIPLSTSNRAGTRHFAVSVVCAVHEELCTDSELSNKLKEVSQLVHGIASAAIASESFKSYKGGEQIMWDIQDSLCLTGICGGVLRKISERTDVEYISKDDFESNLPYGYKAKYITVGDVDDFASYNESKASSFRVKSQSGAQLQTKSTTWNSLSSEIVNIDMRDGGRVKRGNLVVLASMVDKLPNLGGICRLSDVLGAELLCINDISMARNTQFKSVAVTADLWMPMKEVKAEDITSFIRKKKGEGYSIIGLEQTDNSIELNRDFKFPQKTVLVLGKEREGIPGDILVDLDLCIEIKQVGVVRSMNIQTATAVAVHAYSIQHCNA